MNLSGITCFKANKATLINEEHPTINKHEWDISSGDFIESTNGQRNPDPTKDFKKYKKNLLLAALSLSIVLVWLTLTAFSGV